MTIIIMKKVYKNQIRNFSLIFCCYIYTEKNLDLELPSWTEFESDIIYSDSTSSIMASTENNNINQSNQPSNMSPMHETILDDFPYKLPDIDGKKGNVKYLIKKIWKCNA